MPSPLLHCATGVALYSLDRRALSGHRIRYGSLIVVAALLPDFDFVPGLLLNDPNRFHGEWTHSIGFAVMAAFVLGLPAADCRLRMMIWCFLACSLHAVLDTLTVDHRPPYGVPVLWPISSEPLHVGSPLLPGIIHGADSATLGEFARSIFSAVNLRAIGFELAAGVLLILACRGIGNIFNKGTTRSVLVRRDSTDVSASATAAKK